MKKRNVIIIAICVLIAIVLVVSFNSGKKSGGSDNFKVENPNSVIGVWQEIPDAEEEFSSYITVWEFCDNGVVLISKLPADGDMYKDAEEFLDQSGNLIVHGENYSDPMRYTISENILTLYKSDATIYKSFKRIKDDSFLLEEQQKRKEVYEKFKALLKTPVPDEEMKLVGKWRTTYDSEYIIKFNADGTYISSDEENGTYHVYPLSPFPNNYNRDVTQELIDNGFENYNFEKYECVMTDADDSSETKYSLNKLIKIS